MPSPRGGGETRVEIWVREIRDVAYEVEDIVDTVNFMAERRQRQRRGFMGSFSRYCHKPCELTPLHKIGSKIGKIKEKIHGISESTTMYGITNLGESGGERSSDRDDHLQAMRQFPPHFFDDTDVVGFEKDKEKLVNLLIYSANQNRSVISIVGMGGLGKTTLARKLYNMARVKEHFDTPIWLTISQKYDVNAILKDIMKKNISSVTKEELLELYQKTKKNISSVTEEELELYQKKREEELEKMTEGELKEEVYNFLQNKKYFVVMDDVWVIQVWQRIGQIFPDKNNGSRVLLTTRHIEVARHAEPWIPPHELQVLNDTQSLELFRRKAFPPDQDVPAELDKLAQQLAKSCGGLPLALVVLGGLLSRKDRSYDAWSKVVKSMQWESTEEGQQCLNILGLSYNSLPYPLRPCFLYIAAFPEDSTISASKLVRLWVAEGFISQEQRQTMEETARDWLDELMQRCMIQVVRRTKFHGRVKSIRIHDMLRDFGLSEARKDRFLYICNNDMEFMQISNGVSSHRVAFHNYVNDKVPVFLPHLRTLLGFNLGLKDSITAGKFLNGINLVRVLDLENAEYLKKLPKQIGNMIHLRYLGLRNTNLKKLPSSIGHLLNLQTLDVRDTNIIWLPKLFWKIRTLRHVYVNEFIFMTSSISGDLENVQTLRVALSAPTTSDLDKWDIIYFVTFFVIRFIKYWVTTPGFTEEGIFKAWRRTFKEIVEELLIKMGKKMDSLISFTLEWNELPIPIPWDVFWKIHCLRSLKLEGALLFKPQQLLDSSQFLPDLTKLILEESKLEQDPMLMLEKLPNLRFLQLRRNSYVGKSMSCSAGGFPRLQYLILKKIDTLEEWRVEVGAMPGLTRLTINYCRKLKMLPEGLQHLTTLRELELIDMHHEFNDRVKNDDRYKVGHIPSIIFDRAG